MSGDSTNLLSVTIDESDKNELEDFLVTKEICKLRGIKISPNAGKKSCSFLNTDNIQN